MRFWRSDPAPVATREVERSHVWLIDGGQVRSLSDPDEQLQQIFGAWQPEGIPTGSDAALKCSASAASIRLISSLAAECPVHLYRRGDDGSRERERNHAVEKLLSGTGFANPWTPSQEFIRTMTVTAMLEENGAFAKVVRVQRQPRELHALKQVTVEFDELTGEPTYRVPRKRGGQDTLGFRDVIHLKSPTGGAPAKQAALAIELALLIERNVVRLFKNGGRPSGLLTFKQRVAAGAAQEIKTAWQKDIAGADAVGGVAVLGHDVTYTALDYKSTDNELILNRKHQILEVGRFMGVSPTLLAELEDASLNNSEALGRQFVSYTLAPWLTSWVGALSRCLLTEKERETLYIAFETNALTAADLKATMEAFSLAVGGPHMLASEARERQNLTALPADSGADRLNLPQGAPAPQSAAQ